MTVTSTVPEQATPPATEATLRAASPRSRRHAMQVRKRNGDMEPVDVNKIVRAVERWVTDLDEVDPLRIATKTISGLYDGATTAELDKLSIQTAAELIGEEPQYSRLAARLLAAYVDREVRTMHMAFAFDVVEQVRREEPDLFDDDDMQQQVRDMLAEAVECEAHARIPATRRRPATRPT